MKKRLRISSRFSAILVLLLIASPAAIILFSVTPVASATPLTVAGMSGPYANQVQFNIVEDPNVQSLQVQHGNAFIGDWTVGASDISTLKSAGVTVNTTPQAGVFYLAMNNAVWPTNDTAFRKAVSHLVNRDDVVATAYQGYAFAMTTMVPPFYGDLFNPNAVTYDYSTAAAAQELTTGGWTHNVAAHTWTAPNGHVLAWGSGGPGSLGTPCAPSGYTGPCTVQIQTRTDPGRTYFAQQMATNAKTADIPVVSTVMSRTTIFNNLYYSNPPNYVAATAGYLFPPPVDLDGLLYLPFVSTQNVLVTSSPVTWGSNFHRVNDPALDAQLNIIHNSNDRSKVVAAAQQAQAIIASQAYTVPVYTWEIINAYNPHCCGATGAGWQGAVNLANQGVFNDYTFLNMSLPNRQAGGTITADLLGDLDKFNILLMGITVSVWEGYTVGGSPIAVYDFLAGPSPSNPVGIIPLAADWYKSTISGNNQIITANLRSGQTFHDGVPVTATDVAFSALLTRDTIGSASIWAPNLVDAKALNSTEVQFTLNSTSLWRQQQILTLLPILPMHVWAKHAPNTPDLKAISGVTGANDWAQVRPETSGELIGSGPFVFNKYQPGQYLIFDLFKNYWLSPSKSTGGGLPQVTAGQPLQVTLPGGNLRLPMNVTTVIRDSTGATVFAQTNVILNQPGYPTPGSTLNLFANLAAGTYQRTTVFVYNFTRATVTDPITGNPVNITKGQTVQQIAGFQVVPAPPPTTVTQTQTTTATATGTGQTVTQTSTQTATTTVIDYTTVAIVGFVALIVGAVGSYFATRRRT